MTIKWRWKQLLEIAALEGLTKGICRCVLVKTRDEYNNLLASVI